MTNPKTALTELQDKLSQLQKDIAKSLESSLSETDVSQAIDYLNEGIRQLDHTIESISNH